MKKLLTTITLLLMSLATWAAEPTLINGIYYNLNSDGTAEVTNACGGSYDCSTMYSGSVSIPSSVTSNSNSKTYSVTSIGDHAFRGCTGLTSVTIPNSVTSIRNYAFAGCTGLTSVTIGNSVTSIGYYAFYGCQGLTSVTIPTSVTSIGYDAFAGCSGLTSVTIPNSVTSIDTYAFSGCTGLTSVTIGNSVTSIGSSAFYGCSGLTSISIPNSVTSIGSGAFYCCTGLTSIKVEVGNTQYDSRDNCNAIIETATNTLIAGCQSTVIPTSVTSIGNNAFAGCTSLTSIIIPNSVTSIEEGDRFSGNGFGAFSGCKGLTSVTIGNSVTSIGNLAFLDCSGLTSIEIPSSVTSIGQMTFYGCNLQYIVYAGSATGSPWGADCGVYAAKDDYLLFSDAAKTNLVKCIPLATGPIVIPESVTSIGSGAFSNCTGLTGIEIPSSVTSIGDYAFSGCKLQYIVYAGSATGSPWGASCGVYAAKDGYLLFRDAAMTILVKCLPEATGSITIPNSVTSIGGSAFSGCSGLTSITIPESVTSIGGSAFYGCTGLTSVTIGNSVTSIGGSAFSGCTGLKSITIPESVTSIGDFAFYGCQGLTSVTIPTSVTSIGNKAFAGCTGLTSIKVGAGNTKYDSRANCNAIIETATNTLIAGCQTTVIPNSVTSIGNYAFSGCTGLQSVVLGSGMKTIYYDAFRDCTGLQSITCYSMRPPTIINSNNQTNKAFETLPYSTIVYVPADYLNTYMMHNIWGLYDVRPLGAASVQTDDLTVTPHQTTVDITWPSVANAASYEITITTNGITVCTLTFNAQGQLTNIAFRAPAAEPARAAGQGFQFTVTGLEDGSAYSLTLNAKDAVGNVLRTFSQDFSTGATAIEEINADGVALKPRKVLEEGRVIILMPDGRRFDANGRQIK